MLEINLLDVAVVVFLLGFLIRGLTRGMLREAAGLVGFIVGLALARRFQEKIQPSFEPIFDDPNMAAIVAFVVIFVCAMAAVMLLGVALRRFMAVTLTSWVDHALGGLAGLAKGVLLACLIFFLLQGFMPDLEIMKTARVAPVFDSMIDLIRALLPAAFTYKLPSFNL